MSQFSDQESGTVFEQVRQSYSKRIVLMTVGMIITGCASTTLFKYQTKRQGLQSNSISLQTFFVIISQFCNLIFFFVKITLSEWRLAKHFKKYRNLTYSNGKLYEFPSRIIAPSSLFSCAASLLQLYALTSLSSGFFQMLFGFGIVFTPLLSAVFLKRSLYSHTLVGILISVFGFLIAVLSAVFLGQAGIDSDGSWYAMLIMLLGVFFSSCQRVYQEHINRKVEISPFRYSGLEGLYGTLILLTFHIVMFVINSIEHTNYFDIAQELVQWYYTDSLVWSSLLLIACLSLYDLLGIALVSRTSATYRVTNELIRVIFLWAIDIVLYKEYKSGVKYWVNIGLVVFAYMCLVFGTLVVNEVIELTFWGLNRYYGLYRRGEEVSIDEIPDNNRRINDQPLPVN